MTPLLLLAAGEGGPIPSSAADLLSAVTALVVSAALFALLAIKVWPPIVKALDARNEKIVSEIKAAEEARAAAGRAMEEHRRELEKARQEASSLIAEAREQARRAADELKARSDAEMAERLAKATADIDAAKRRAVGELHAEAATLATAVASRILQREISAADQQRLVEETLSQIGSDRRN